MTLAETIQWAQKRCDAFTVAVREAGYKSRWDRIEWDKHPALKAARNAHHEAGRVLHDAFIESRKEKQNG